VKKILALMLVMVMLLTVQVSSVVADSSYSSFARKFSTGLSHSVALKDDGTVWTWGGNQSYELGDGTNKSRSAPGQVKGIKDVIAVTAGVGMTIALKKDGTVWAWGQNTNGQITPGKKGNTGTPTQVKGLSGIVAICNTVALKKDGTVWEWGLSEDDDRNNCIPPVQVKGLTDVIDISSVSCVNLALKKDGTVWAWNHYGNNIFGQLGNGTMERTYGPVKVVNLTDVVDISAGDGFCLALKKDGTVWAWGKDDSIWGSYWNFNDSPVPLQIEGLTDVIRVAAGGRRATVLKKDGTVWQWGFLSSKNSLGTLIENTNKPQKVEGLSDIIEISSRWYHGMALKSDGTLWQWNGKNPVSQVPFRIKVTLPASPTSSKVLVNGEVISFEAYHIGGNNYFKLRDLAAAVNGTQKQFEVEWDAAKNAINIITNRAYTPVGGELSTSANPKSKEAKPTTSKVYVNGQEVSFTAYNIDGSNYFKLRDIAKVIDFGVTWDGTTDTIGIDTSIPYNE